MIIVTVVFIDACITPGAVFTTDSNKVFPDNLHVSRQVA